MKTFLIPIIALAFSIATASAQEFGFAEVKNANLVYLLNNVEVMKRYELRKFELNTMVYIVADPSGSAHSPDTDEITKSVYIAVSEDWDALERHLFKLNSVYNPEIINFSNTGESPVLTLKYGPYNKLQTVNIKIKLKSLIIK